MAKRIIEIWNLITFGQLIDIIAFFFIFVISVLVKPFLPKKIWLIQENPNEACDNGYIFFKYLRENRKEIEAYYVINKKSKDYEKVRNLGNIINYRSLRHWMYYLNAEKIIVTQKYANPSNALFYLLHTRNILKIPRIFLQHGITKDDCEMFYYHRTNFRLFICGAKKEYEYVREKFQYPKDYVVYTGLARFDNLNVVKDTNNKFILMMPTWRKWIRKQKDFDRFMQNYYNLITNPELIDNLNKNNIYLQVVLHKNSKKFLYNREMQSKNVKINHNEEVDIQELLNKTELLITDYSSIFMDIAYRKRPIIYYQFDEKEYRKKQLPEGYFSYKSNGFGEIFENPQLLIKKIEYYIKNDFKIEEIYSKRMDEFFERKDTNNCQRILEEIEKIK